MATWAWIMIVIYFLGVGFFAGADALDDEVKLSGFSSFMLIFLWPALVVVAALDHATIKRIKGNTVKNR